MQDVAPDGSYVMLSVGEIRRVPGRIGFFRSPILDAIEFRDVQLLKDGAVIDEVAYFKLGAVRRGPVLPGARQTGELERQFREFAAFESLLPSEPRREWGLPRELSAPTAMEKASRCPSHPSSGW
jgi:hypothetical protein